MSKLKLYSKVARLFLGRKIVTDADIGQAYDRVSNNYAHCFLSAMHVHNDEMISELAKHLEQSKTLKVLDLAAGTGYNSLALREFFPAANLTLVDISQNMLNEARKNLNQDASSVNDNASFVADDMLGYLETCPDEVFDVILCGWAIKYRPPRQMVRQCRRVLRQGGYMAVIVNKKDTLPQVARIYPALLAKHSGRISKLMLRLPNPKSITAFDNWFLKNSFFKIVSREGFHDFEFETSRELAEFVVSTGALAGFDVMLDLRNPDVQADMVRLLEQYRFTTATHRYVYGIYQKNGRRRNKTNE